jgi:hypothetical protein
VADGRLVVVTPPVTGDALDDALQLYGPAAVDDALPRLRQLAGALDRGAREGLSHGALHPRDIMVSADDTHLVGLGVADALARVGVATHRESRYTAPEVLASDVGTSAGDQFSLAVIAHEWMFAGAVSPADGWLAIPVITGLDVPAVQRAFDTATAADPAERFRTCVEFCSALERGAGVRKPLALEPAVEVTELPLGGHVGFAGGAASVFSPALPSPDKRQFGMLALLAALFVGIALGAAGMRLLAGPAPARTMTDASLESTEAALAQGPASSASPSEVVDPPIVPPRDDLPPEAPTARAMPDATRAAQTDAGLLIHSTPAGARVTIDGVDRGTTPVAVRGLALGTRLVGISRVGYETAERLVTLTPSRPSRTLDVDLVAVTRVAPRDVPAPAAPAASVAASGSLVVDSRPSGAMVTVDGRPSGNTPVTLTAVAPGRHTVRIERPGYRPVTTTVMIKSGERARVAARLEGGSNEE